jgi:hypothetical protein
MPQALRELLRRESSGITLECCAGRNPQATADQVWDTYRRRPEGQGAVLSAVPENGSQGAMANAAKPFWEEV